MFAEESISAMSFVKVEIMQNKEIKRLQVNSETSTC